MEKKTAAEAAGSLLGLIFMSLIWALAFKLDVEFWTNHLGHFRHVSILPALLAGFLLPGKVMYSASAFTLCYWLLT